MSGILKSFQVNEEVVFLHEEGGGVITKIEGKLLYVLDETGFERPFFFHQVTHVKGSMRKIELPDEIILEQTSLTKNRKGNMQEIPTIDLHIEELVDDHSNWTNHEILTYQLKAFRDFLALSEEKKLKRIVLIHGVGNGRLKQEIRTYLNGNKRYSYQDANFTKFGFGGATQVEIRLNWKD